MPPVIRHSCHIKGAYIVEQVATGENCRLGVPRRLTALDVQQNMLPLIPVMLAVTVSRFTTILYCTKKVKYVS